MDKTHFRLEPGERLAQYVLVPVVQAEFEQVEEFVATNAVQVVLDIQGTLSFFHYHFKCNVLLKNVAFSY